MEEQLHYTEVSTPIGPMVLLAESKGLCSIQFGRFCDVQPVLQKWTRRWLGTDKLTVGQQQLGSAAKQLQEYFTGSRKIFDLTLNLHGTPFQKRVWTSLMSIPYGTTWTYKDVGIDIGSVQAVRAIGGANHNNPLSVVIPCHRVIGSDGKLVGYGGGLHIKKHLLTLEGAVF